jgi:hypothetical protein
VIIETDSAYLGKGWLLLKKPPFPLVVVVNMFDHIEGADQIENFIAVGQGRDGAERPGAAARRAGRNRCGRESAKSCATLTQDVRELWKVTRSCTRIAGAIHLRS